MKWSLNELRYTGEKPLEFSKEFDLKTELHQRNPEILDASPVLIKGLITIDEFSTLLYGQVKTTVTLPSTRSFKPVAVPLDFDFTEHYLSKFERTKLNQASDSDIVIVLDDDIIDLKKIIVDNILLQIPMQVLAPDEQDTTASLPTGNGWDVVTEDQVANEQQKSDNIDPRFAKLQGFFDKNSDD